MGSAALDTEDTPATRAQEQPLSKTAAEKERKKRAKARIAVEHVDIIRDEFWLRRPWILSGKAGKLKE